VELYLHSHNTPSWRGVKLKHGENVWRTSCTGIQFGNDHELHTQNMTKWTDGNALQIHIHIHIPYFCTSFITSYNMVVHLFWYHRIQTGRFKFEWMLLIMLWFIRVPPIHPLRYRRSRQKLRHNVLCGQHNGSIFEKTMFLTTNLAVIL